MGKEAKIGLAVILVLLIFFGVVLYKRLSGMHGDTPPTGVQTQVAGDTPAPELKKPVPDQPTPPPSMPRIVAAKSGSNELSKTAAPANLDDWSVASDKKLFGKHETYNRKDSSPPSFMPKLVGATTEASGTTDAAALAPAASSPPTARYTGFEPRATDAADQQPAAQTARLPGPFTANVLSNPVRNTVPPEPHDPFNAQAQSGPPQAQAGAPPLGSGGYQDGAGDQYAAGGPGRYQAPGYTGSPYSTYRSPSDPPRHHGPDQGYGGAYHSGNLSRPVDVGQALASDGSYVVQPNDNYWTISGKVYGTGAYFRALAEHNRKRNPDRDQLQPGEKISAPPVAELEKSYRDLCPKPEHREVADGRVSMVSSLSPPGGGRVYVVQEGDTLFDIARFELGKASRWAEIFQLNRDALGDQYNYLTPGMQLVLPVDQPPVGAPPRGYPAEKITERPGSLLRR